jgi:hypothetical protein
MDDNSGFAWLARLLLNDLTTASTRGRGRCYIRRMNSEGLDAQARKRIERTSA